MATFTRYIWYPFWASVAPLRLLPSSSLALAA